MIQNNKPFKVISKCVFFNVLHLVARAVKFKELRKDIKHFLIIVWGWYLCDKNFYDGIMTVLRLWLSSLSAGKINIMLNCKFQLGRMDWRRESVTYGIMVWILFDLKGHFVKFVLSSFLLQSQE